MVVVPRAEWQPRLHVACCMQSYWPWLAAAAPAAGLPWGWRWLALVRGGSAGAGPGSGLGLLARGGAYPGRSGCGLYESFRNSVATRKYE